MSKNITATIGDICEIDTPEGLAYIQYTHDGKGMGQLVRVLPGLFDARPTDLVTLAKEKELYFTFYTLNYALRDDQAKIVSHQPVPPWAHAYPLMRWSGASDRDGKALAWKIFKASDSLTLETHQRTPIVRTLTPQQESLSIHQLWPHPVMVKQLARGWTPERAEELRLQDIAMRDAEGKLVQNTEGGVTDEPMRHFFYFPTKVKAEDASKHLRGRGFSVEVRMGADGENWLALATKTTPATGQQMGVLRDEMEAVATQFGGGYDGWELPVDSPLSADTGKVD